MGVALLDGTSGAGSVTNAGATSRANIAFNKRAAIRVVNGATNPVTFTVEGSLDGAGWETVAYGVGASGAYTQTARTTPAGTDEILFLPPDDLLGFVRVNVSAPNANGSTFRVFGGG